MRNNLLQPPTKPDRLSAGWQLARLEGERDRANRATRSMENARDQAKRAEAEVDSLRARNERLCDKAEALAMLEAEAEACVPKLNAST